MFPELLRSHWILITILLLGGGIRGMYLREQCARPEFRVPLVDAEYHDYWARALAFGNWAPPPGRPDPRIRSTPFFRPPGYSYFLAGVYKVCGRGYLWPRVAQVLLGLLDALLARWLAARAFGRTAGLVVLALMACSWTLVFFEVELLDPILTTTFLLLMAAALAGWRERASLVRLGAAGVAAGACAVVRPNALLLLAPAWLWVGWIERRRGSSHRGWFRAGLALLAGAALAVAPATLRNLVVAREPILVSTNAGINLYIGQNDRADGLVRGALPGFDTLDDCFDWPALVRSAARKVGHPLTDSQASRYFSGLAFRWMAAHPGRTVALEARKWLLFWGPAEPRDIREVELERSASPLLKHLPGGFPFAVALALAGAAALLGLPGGKGRRGVHPRVGVGDTVVARTSLGGALPHACDFSRAPRELVALMAGLTLVWALSFVPFAIAARYRVPLLPFLFIFGAGFLTRIGEEARHRRWRQVAVGGGLLVLLLVFTSHDFTAQCPSAARWHYQRGTVLCRLERFGEGVDEFNAALRENPGYQPVYNDLGAALARGGRMEEATRAFEGALRLSPGDLVAARNLEASRRLLGASSAR